METQEKQKPKGKYFSPTQNYAQSLKKKNATDSTKSSEKGNFPVQELHSPVLTEFLASPHFPI